MRYLVFIALALVLLVGASSALPGEVTQTIVATATGGDVYQEAYNDVDDAAGDVTQTITMVADATGEVTQDGYNEAYVDSAGAVVTQSLSMDATGENVYQNYWYGYGNYADVYGTGTTITQTILQNANAVDYLYQYADNEAFQDGGSLADQSITQTAVAGGDVDQYAYNDVYSYGDGAAAFQSAFMDAIAGGYAYQYGYNYADMYDYDTILVGQSAVLNAVAGDYVYQDFENDNYYAGSSTVSDQAITMSGTAGTFVDQFLNNNFYTYDLVSEGTQVLTAAAFAADGSAYQDAYNYMSTYGDDILGQSIFLNAVATEDVTQYGYNYEDGYYDPNYDIGQEVWLAGDGAYVYQDAYNEAYFSDFADVAQFIALSAISDDAGVDQYAENYAENYWAAGESTNNIGQEITGAATGGDDSYQYFYNYADLYYGDLSTYNVTQINTATLSATDYADQYLYNWIDWYNTHTGSIAMDILGDASADSVYQYHENWVEVYY